MSTAPPINPFTSPSYRRWFAGETLLALGGAMAFGSTLLAIDLLGSVEQAGQVGGLLAGVTLVGTLLGGALGDSYPRRTLIRRAVLVSAAGGIVLTAIATWAGLGGDAAPWWLAAGFVGASAVIALTNALADPPLDGALKSLITPEQFPRALSAATARTSVISIAGSPAAGALYGVHPALPPVLSLVCDVAFLGVLGRIRGNLGPRSEQGQTAAEPRSPRLAAAMRGFPMGLAFLRSRPALSRVLWCAPLINIMVFTAGSWVIFRLSEDGVDAFGIGLASAGFAVGGILGSAAAPFVTDRVPAGVLAIGGLGLMSALFAALFVLPHTPAVMFAVTALCMIPSPALNGALFGHVFAETPDSLQSRVQATFMVVADLARVPAPILAGFAAGRGLDAPLGLAVCGIGVTGVTLLATSKHVREIGRRGAAAD
ncbi:MFS transporter [Falsarthrobacter nasiphocae]|uniref:MFS family permease n=1 Tax=Falsarthrobacter nasiphocae TaxID=189863 RepID=A0AAE3YDI3_9MICC|nr:MFS transporter [Falsarthrobacter nasiphocae]MDR6891180.1 MFS family permease [Falsarthrobacter nasiphocae]